MSHRIFSLSLIWLVAGLGACSVDAESNTGLVVVVTLDDSAVVDGQATPLDGLRFYVAVKKPGTEIWILNEALAGRPVDVQGRDLKAEPYRLFMAENGDGEMETLKIVVVGEKDGGRRLFGKLTEPEQQTLEYGRILERTIALRHEPNDMGLTWTATGCMLSADGAIRFGSAGDKDCDGHLSIEFGGEDCDDENPAVNPAADDTRDCDGVDNDCNNVVDQGGNIDADGDGVTPCEGDCDDSNPDVHPGAVEECDGIDNNCNGQCDEGDAFDADKDGYTICGTLRIDGGKRCEAVMFPDCDDSNPQVYPGAPELCNGIDDNCNGICDEGTDPDEDGFNECGSIPGEAVIEGALCTAPDAAFIDCAPEDKNAFPGAFEVCDGVNNDCDNTTSPSTDTCYVHANGDVTADCHSGTATCTEGGGTASWACMPNTTDIQSPALCGAWSLCSSSPVPEICIATAVDRSNTMVCQAHVATGMGAPCWESPPTFELPFGAQTMNGCVWTLQAPPEVPGWEFYGLINPDDSTAEMTLRLESCRAALVAKPGYQGGSQQLQGTLSLVRLSAQQNVLMIIPFSVTVDNDCSAGSSLTCNVLSVP